MFRPRDSEPSYFSFNGHENNSSGAGDALHTQWPDIATCQRYCYRPLN